MKRLNGMQLNALKRAIAEDAEADVKRASAMDVTTGGFAWAVMRATMAGDRAIGNAMDNNEFGSVVVEPWQLDILRAHFVERFMHEIGSLIEEAHCG